MNEKECMKIGVFGSSGFSREVADICIALNYSAIVFIDFQPTDHQYFGFPLISEGNLSELINENYSFAIGAGDNRVRNEIYKKHTGLVYPNLIHPSATMGYNQLEELETKKGNIVAAGVRLTNNIKVGNFGIFNLNCTVGHDSIFGDFISIAPGATVSGNVQIQDGAYVGTNSAIIQGKSIEDKLIIGEYSMIGAGSVVISNVDPHSVYVGVPAKKIK